MLNCLKTCNALSLAVAIFALQPWGMVFAGGDPTPAIDEQQLHAPPTATEHLAPPLEETESKTEAAPTEPDLSATPEPAPYPGVTPYNLGYKTEINGLGLKSHRMLTIEPGGLYKLYGKASVLFIAIEEYSVFSQKPDGGIQPQSYFYDRKGLGDKKDYHIHFDWQQQRAINQLKKDPWDIAISPGMQDMLSHQEQFRLDLVHAEPQPPYSTYDYTIVKKKKIKQYHYSPIGEETIDTAAGKLRTLKVEKLENDDDRKTTVWLARDWGYVIARLEYIKGDDVHRMELTGGEIGGESIRGL